MNVCMNVVRNRGAAVHDPGAAVHRAGGPRGAADAGGGPPADQVGRGRAAARAVEPLGRRLLAGRRVPGRGRRGGPRQHAAPRRARLSLARQQEVPYKLFHTNLIRYLMKYWFIYRFVVLSLRCMKLCCCEFK